MKLTAILLLSASLQISAAGFSQRITLTERNAPVKKVLEKIKQQTGFDFFYHNRTVDNVGRISVSVQSATLSETMDACFRNTPLTYTITDKIIVINRKVSEKPEPAPVPQEAIDAQIEVTGRVMNESGEALAGASVTVKGESRSVTADNSGHFRISADRNAVLVVSFVGYVSREVPVSGQNNLLIVLQLEDSKLQGVVVVAYGTQRKENVTSAISEIKGEELTRRPISNLQQSMQGLAPGVTVMDLGGAPGRSAATIRVRGITTFNINSASGTYGGYDLAKNDALVIVDGIEQRLIDFNPDDIETITVLKDASSTAIYGSRATNGVI